MSRKMSLSLGLAVAMLLTFAVVAFAQTPAATETQTPAATETVTDVTTATVTSAVTETVAADVTGCPYGDFVDEDGDGVCDNCPNGEGHPYGMHSGMHGSHHMGGYGMWQQPDDESQPQMGRSWHRGMNRGWNWSWNR